MRLDLVCNQDDRRPLRGVPVTLLRHHLRRLLAPLQSVPPLSSLLCHGSNLLTKGVPGRPGRFRETGVKYVLKRFPDDPTITWEEWRQKPDVFVSDDDDEDDNGT